MPRLLFCDGSRWLLFERPMEVLECSEPEQVRPLLAALDRAVGRGAYAAGYLAYEAAAGLGLPCRPRDPDGPPLAWFGVFDRPEVIDLPQAEGAGHAGPWTTSLDKEGYARAIATVHEHLARGDTYQVNLTFPLEAPFEGDPFSFFVRLHLAQRSAHSAFVDTGRFVIASASPELFFEQESESILVRPMKGTAPRGLTEDEDEQRSRELAASAKNRAENVMIVDMMRNDLGRIANEVEVTSLFEVEAYPTLLQMVSTVRARSAAPTGAILAALFPSASVTGAPRHRTMQIIAKLEARPRGVYTGAIGWMGPGRARFSVAIRSAVVDRRTGRAVYGVGSGVVADSTAGAEYEECLLKARVLEEEPFALLESVPFTPEGGLLRAEAHLARLASSARRFGFDLDPQRARQVLSAAVAGTSVPARVRLVLTGSGALTAEAIALVPGPQPVRLGLARHSVSSEDLWLRHKTTRRAAYELAAASRPDIDEVLLWNESREITETPIANVVVELGGRLVTPQESAGLLPGVLRGELLREGKVSEAVVTIDDLARASGIFLVSSARGWREASLADD